MKKRESYAVKLVNIINSCRTLAHIETTKKMVERFEQMFDDTLPLRRWLMNKEFELSIQKLLK